MSNLSVKRRLDQFRALFLNAIDSDFSTQRDLVLCQFAFCGYIISRPQLLGIDPNSNHENLEAFGHFWRVVGHCIGLDPRFNLSSAELRETNSRILSMTPQLIGPAFMSHSNTYVKIVLDFVDIFWYFRPIISMDSVLFLSNRLAGIPGHYLTQTERQYDLQAIDGHQEYLRTFNKRKLQCELYSPKCYAYSVSMSWKDKLIISGVVHSFEKYSTCRVYRWVWNTLIWFGRFCIRQLSFMVVRLGFQNSYDSFWTMRKAALINIRGGGGGRGCRYYQKWKRPFNMDEKDMLNE